MITRINLIESQPFSFTYLKLVQGIAVVVGIVALLTSFQYFQFYRQTRALATQQQALNRLKADHDALRSRPVKKKLDIGRFQSLVDKIEGAPKWSRILSDISVRMPGRLRLTSIKSLTPSAGTTVPVSRKKDKDKDPSKVDENDKKAAAQKKREQEKMDITTRRMEITGLSADERLVTEFLKKIRESDQFRSAVLSESERSLMGYSFKIVSEAVNSVK